MAKCRDSNDWVQIGTILALACVMNSGCGPGGASKPVSTAPIRGLDATSTARVPAAPKQGAIDPTGLIREWVVLGPFPNPERDGKRLGLDQDYLGPLGGEAKADISTGTQFVPADGLTPPFAAKNIQTADGHVDFEQVLGKLDRQTAYASCRLNLDQDQEIRFYLGSDDGAKVWVNGAQVFRVVTPGRPLVRGQNRFVAPLHRGANTVLVKVEDNMGDWGFVLQAFDERGYEANQRKVDVAKALVSGTIHPKGKWDYMFPSDSFPEIAWKFQEGTPDEPNAIPQFQVHWFNARLQEETTPSGPGRYMAYAEGHTKDGTLVRRSETFFCRPKDWEPWRQKTRAFLDFIPGGPFEESAWKERSGIVATLLGSGLVRIMETEESGAIVTSYLHEAKPLGKKPGHLDDPEVANSEAQLSLRRKILGLAAPIVLRPPEFLAKASPIVRLGTPGEAGMTPAAVQKIRAAAKVWYEDSKEPFVVSISGKGVVFFHEPFGNVTRETEFPWASITKFVGGILIARFLDQGLVQLDDPIGKHLPDWPKSGPKMITLRQCFTHTAGIGALGDAHLEGPWGDNQLANALAMLELGKRYDYSSIGYVPIAKVMETISGQSTRRLVYEQIFEPLGGRPTGPSVLGYGIQSTALDLVRLGQLVLNQGSYGNKKLFSTETFTALLPRPLHEFYPDLDPTLRGGIGIEAMVDKDPRGGKEGFAADKVLLSPNTIGHGAASSTVFRVDPDHQLVIAVARRQAGKNYDRHLSEFLQSIDDALR